LEAPFEYGDSGTGPGVWNRDGEEAILGRHTEALLSNAPDGYVERSMG
jgi:hypothetical protein